MSDEANTHKADKIIPIVPSIKGIQVSDILLHFFIPTPITYNTGINL